MRAALRFSEILIVALGAGAAAAGPLTGEPTNNDLITSPPAGFEHYRGYAFDLSENSDRKDVTAISDNVRHQLDVVENAGLSPKVLRFFRSVPIVANEMACLEEGAAAACYGSAVPRRGRGTRELTVLGPGKQQWTNPDPVDLAVDSGLGVIMLRPNVLRYAQDPVILHEFLHVYHAKLMPN